MDETTALSGLPYVVIGGIATRAYMPERFTKDLDVLIAPEAYEEAGRRLTAAGWRCQQNLTFPSSGLGLFGSHWTRGAADLDVVSSYESWTEEALSRPASDTTGLRVIALSYLVLMKLDSSRAQDTADISRMLAFVDDETMAAIRSVVTRYSRDSQALDDLESLREIGRWELEVADEERPRQP
ncbi:MAG: hypothetical protein ACREM8_05705 [Vulcanimicrobiaceae bacterium]